MSLDLPTFAKSRGFTAEELGRFDVHVEGETVVIPIAGRNGVWYERIHRPGGSPKYQSPEGATPHLFNPLGLGPQSGEVWIAEGEFDTLSLVVAGVPALGILGTQTFLSTWALLFEQAEIVLALDADASGDEAADKLTQLWAPGQVSRFRPTPYTDLNEWLVADRGGFTEAVLGW